MISFLHCTLFAALALSGFCIKAGRLRPPLLPPCSTCPLGPRPRPGPCSNCPLRPRPRPCSTCPLRPRPGRFPPPLLPPCSLFSPDSSWPSDKVSFSNLTFPIDQNTRNLTLFNLSLLTHQSLSFTFTTTSPDEDEDGAPSLAFLLVRSPQLAPPGSSMQSMELSFTCITKLECFPQQLPLHVCDPLPQPIHAPISCSSEPDPYKSDKTRFKDEVSLTHDATAAAIHLQAIFYSGGLKINQTFTLSTNPLLFDSTLSSNESTTLFVGYITSGEVTINVTSEGGLAMMNSAPSPITMPFIDHGDNTKSNHKKVVVSLVWPIVGVSIVGLMTLVIFITKRHKSPSLATSRPPAEHGAPPEPSRAPCSHHDLETSAPPIMRALPPSPPSSDASQISGTASWSQQPNPR